MRRLTLFATLIGSSLSIVMVCLIRYLILIAILVSYETR